AADFAERARLLGLATAPLVWPTAPRQPLASLDASRDPAGTYTTHRRWGAGPVRSEERWRVGDLSSLLAGPLAARVLAEAGATVTKLESATRPDSARDTPHFYNWLHAPAETVVQVDLATQAGRQEAGALIDEADVVIEASRPRALEQLGLGPDDRASH